MTASDRLSALAPRYDLVIIGGGITGAGVLREATRTGASILLVDKSDFASGTSSWSSKLVHGGLRYLQHGQWRLTLESVRERDRLLREAPGLVDLQPFLMPIHRGQKPGRALMQTGLLLYDAMAGRRRSHWLDRAAALRAEPTLTDRELVGAMAFADARTDDARLVQRLIEDARAAGATALNYAAVEDLVRDSDRVVGVALKDQLSGAQCSIAAGLVINASGVWARQFASATAAAPLLRPLRGSHFVFDAVRLPICHAVSWLHPRDHRPVFAYPWEGAVILGTTDLDHDVRALDDPHMSESESSYLIEALRDRFPRQELSAADAICTFAGVRPVVAGGEANPSAESRESALWSSPGLVSITGGKLTTFRVTARRVLREAARQLPPLAPQADVPLFDGALAADAGQQRIIGRFGLAYAQRMAAAFGAADTGRVGHTPYTWAELRWSARYEQVVHLEDLLMRRTRIGLVCANGGRELLEDIRAHVQADLGWDDAVWEAERTRYLGDWSRRHAPA